MSDGDCDLINNNEICGYDGGDCCPSTCIDEKYNCDDHADHPDHSQYMPGWEYGHYCHDLGAEECGEESSFPDCGDSICNCGETYELCSDDCFDSGECPDGFLPNCSEEPIIDCCAAPGTKSSYIIEKMKFKGNVYASDLSKKRGKLGKETAKRLKIPIQWDYKDASADGFPIADRILIDAPCTGTGVIGRRPDIRWRRKKNDTKSMADIQTAILGHMAQFLKPNGILVYATCSLELEENWNVVESFLKLNNNFTLESGKNFVPSSWLNHQGCLETFPPRDKVDGMFAARIRKK